MMQITCPHCGEREESEFSYGGEAHKARPEGGGLEMDDKTWAEWTFMHKSPKGWFYERWNHAGGCRRWFNCVRHTVSSEILTTYPAGTPAPDLETLLAQRDAKKAG